MSKLLILSIALSFKACFAFSNYEHERYIAVDPYMIVTVCVNGIEYIIINGRITPSINKDSKINQCNY
jgi:hypothetical protein